MNVTRDIASTRAALAAVRQAGRPIALVPTMGALHAGHRSLIEAARRDGGFVVVSIFVNPTQFCPSEDFVRYPHDESSDLKQCEEAGVELVFFPLVEAMYEQDAVTKVHVGRLTETLCGPFRPGHFDGVTTVVNLLFNIVQPDVAYFGQKDAQQLAVIKRMVRDLRMPVRIVACPTVRGPNGLAISSRNESLSDAQRRQAASLYRALCDARDRIRGGERDAAAVTREMHRIITEAGPARVDYISVVDPETMQPVERIASPVLIALAVHIGATRLIDNLSVDPGVRSP